MKRCILVSVRKNVDKETKDELLFLTLYRLPTKMKNGGLYYPRPNESIINACINKSKAPMDFELFESLLPGVLVDVTFGLNEFNNKTFVSKCDFVPNTNLFNEEDLYL
jgi:hypothetical protein